MIENFLDTYANLTLKSIFMLKWLNNRCRNAGFVLKVDDDVFVNPENLMKTIESPTLKTITLDFQETKSETINYALIGKTMIDIKPERNSFHRWFIPRNIFPYDTFPPYLIGFCYLFTGSLIEAIYTCTLERYGCKLMLFNGKSQRGKNIVLKLLFSF